MIEEIGGDGGGGGGVDGGNCGGEGGGHPGQCQVFFVCKATALCTSEFSVTTVP